MSKTIQSRIQHSVYTAAVLKAKNPVLLKGEVVYESDTCKYKIGDGSTAWNLSLIHISEPTRRS